MRFVALEVAGFRGIWDETFEFPEDSPFLLFGMNGTGKTSLYQALYFAVTGQLPPIVPTTDPTPAETYRHLDLDESEDAVVVLHLTNNSTSTTISRRIKYDGEISSSFATEGARELAESQQSELCFLTRRRFSAMVEAAEEERWRRLSPLLGHHKLMRYRNGLRLIKRQIKSDLRLSNLKTKKSTQETQRQRIAERYNQQLAESELEEFSPEILSAQLASLGIDLPEFSTLDDIDWNTLKDRLKGAERLEDLSDAISTVRRVIELTTFSIPHTLNFDDLYTFMEDISDSTQRAHQILHADFFDTAKTVVSDYDSEKCPVCGETPDDWDDVRRRLADKHDRLKHLADERSELAAGISREQTYATSVAQDLRELLDDSETELPPSISSELESALRSLLARLFRYAGLMNLLSTRVGESIPKPLSRTEAAELKATRQTLAQKSSRITSVFEALLDDLNEEFEALSESDTRIRLEQLRNLCERYVDLTDKTQEIERLRKKISITEDVVEEVQTYADKVDKEEASLSTSMLSQVESRVTRIFRSITNQPNLSPSISRDDDHGVPVANITIENFHNRGTVPAREYLSESNRNALGIAIFFAGLEFRSPELDSLVMDDITHSTDFLHRRGLARFLVDDVAQNRQTILLTHVDNWFEYLMKLFDNQAKGIRITEWTPTALKTTEDHWHSLLTKAEDAITSQREGAANALRMAIEEFLDEACERYHVMIPYKTSAEKVTAETKRNRLIATIKERATKGKSVIDPSAPSIRTFANSQTIANLGSHHKTRYDFDHIDLVEALEDFRKFAQLFQCSNNTTDGQCGWMLRRLSGPSDGNCPSCGARLNP